MIGEDAANPGPIDNSHLLEGTNDVLTFLLLIMIVTYSYSSLFIAIYLTYNGDVLDYVP